MVTGEKQGITQIGTSPHRTIRTHPHLYFSLDQKWAFEANLQLSPLACSPLAGEAPQEC